MKSYLPKNPDISYKSIIPRRGKWAKIHYGLYRLYSSCAGYTAGTYPNNTTEERVLIALLLLLTKIYPNMTQDDAVDALEEIDNHNFFTDTGLLYESFISNDMDSEKAKELVSNVIDNYIQDTAGINSLKVSNVIAHVVYSSLGKEVLLDYILARLSGKAK